MNQEPPTERRRRTRVPFDGTVHITRPDGRTVPATLHDISMAGVLIAVEPPLALGDECQLRLRLSDEAQIECDSQVVRTDSKSGVAGLKIGQIDVESVRHLYQLVTLNFGNTDQIAAELFDRSVGQ